MKDAACCCSGQILSEFFFVYGVLFCDLICVLIFVFNVHLSYCSYNFLIIVCAFKGYVLAISYHVLHYLMKCVSIFTHCNWFQVLASRGQATSTIVWGFSTTEADRDNDSVLPPKRALFEAF
jgi:hypothetical protein